MNEQFLDTGRDFVDLMTRDQLIEECRRLTAMLDAERKMVKELQARISSLQTKL